VKYEKEVHTKRMNICGLPTMREDSPILKRFDIFDIFLMLLMIFDILTIGGKEIII